MQISQNTLNLLKNYVGINSGINIPKDSNRIITTDIKGGSWSSAVVDETFDGDIVVGNLAQFLNAVDFFDNPEFEIDEKYITITSSDGKEIKYQQSISAAVEQPNKTVKSVDKYNATLHLSSADIKSALKAARTLGIDMVGFVYNKDGCYFIVNDPSIKANSFSIPITTPDVSDDTNEFTVYVRIANFKLMTDYDYEVKILMANGKGRVDAVALNAPYENLVYVFAVEAQYSSCE